jgi:hypothetical protein
LKSVSVIAWALAMCPGSNRLEVEVLPG